MVYKKELKLKELKRIKSESLLRKLKASPIDYKDGDLKADYGSAVVKKNTSNKKGPHKGKQQPHAKKGPYFIQEEEAEKKKKKRKEEDNDQESSRGDGHKEEHRGNPRLGYAEKEFPKEQPQEAWEYFDPATKYYSDYTDKRDISQQDLEEIVGQAKEEMDPILEKYWKPEWMGTVTTTDQSAMRQVPAQDALEKVIWAWKNGKYQSKVDYNEYKWMLEQLVQENAEKTASVKTRLEEDMPVSKIELEVETVIQNLLNLDPPVQDINIAWRILDDPDNSGYKVPRKLRNLKEHIKYQVLLRYLNRDIYLVPNLDGTPPLDELYPAYPQAEDAKNKTASSKALFVLNSIYNLRSELDNLITKVASKAKFNPATAFKKLFRSKKKKLTMNDLSYQLKSNYQLEDEEVESAITNALGEGIISRKDLDQYSYQGGFGSPVKTLKRKEDSLLGKQNKIQAEIAKLEQQIAAKQNRLDALEKDWNDLRNNIDLEQLKHSDLPEYTKRVFDSDIRAHLSKAIIDQKGNAVKSYQLRFDKVNEEYKPVFTLTLYNVDEGLDTETLKKAASLFKQRLQRLLNRNVGYVDYNLYGDGVVLKDEENNRAYTTVTLEFDLPLVDPKQIDVIKNEINLLMEWLDDHFIF